MFAAVAGAITFVGPLTGWLVERGNEQMGHSYESVEATGLDSQVNGGFLGVYVLGLGLLSMLAAVAVAVRETPRPASAVLRLSAVVTLALVSAALLVGLDLLRIGGIREQGPDPPPAYQHWSRGGAGAGIWLTLFAAFFGAYCAGGLFLKIRGENRARPKSM